MEGRLRKLFAPKPPQQIMIESGTPVNPNYQRLVVLTVSYISQAFFVVVIKTFMEEICILIFLGSVQCSNQTLLFFFFGGVAWVNTSNMKSRKERKKKVKFYEINYEKSFSETIWKTAA